MFSTRHRVITPPLCTAGTRAQEEIPLTNSLKLQNIRADFKKKTHTHTQRKVKVINDTSSHIHTVTEAPVPNFNGSLFVL